MNPNTDRDEVRCSCGQPVSKAAIDAVLAKRRSGAKWDKSGLKEACQRGLAIGRTHQEFDLQLLLDMLLEIERLESLLDGQAVEIFVGPCVGCGHNNYDAECKECRQRWMEGRMSVVCGCPCAKHNSLVNAATRMRDACVAKVKEIHEERLRELRALTEQGETEQKDADYERAVLFVLSDVIDAIQSLTLDQVEQKQ